MKKIVCVLLLFFYISRVSAQQNLEVGYFLTNTFEPIDNMIAFDPAKGNAINITANGMQNFILGYFIDKDGEKTEGYIKKLLGSKEFEFKKTTSDEPVKVKASAVKAYKVGLDSFVVMQNLQTVNFSYPHIKYPKFVLVESYNDSIVIYKHDKKTSVDRFLKYQNKFYSVPLHHSKNFRNRLLSLFDHNEFITEYIDQTKIGQHNIDQLLDALKNYQIFQNKDSIYLNQQYQECSRAEASYFAMITDVKDLNFTLSYFDTNGQKLATGQYKSLKPQIRHGQFEWYHPNGNIRKIASYEDNESARSENFYSNGQLHYIQKNSPYDGLVYEKVFDPTGKEVANLNMAKAQESFYDSVRSRQITRHYKRGLLIESKVYHKSEALTYTQMTKRNLKYIKMSESMWNHFKSILRYDDEMILAEEQGTAYVRLLVDGEGKLIEIEILQGISEETDKKITDAFIKTNNNHKIWRASKNFEGEFMTQEIVIPINFSIKSESLQNNYFYYDPFMFNQWHQQMQQQMLMESIQVPQGF